MCIAFAHANGLAQNAKTVETKHFDRRSMAKPTSLTAEQIKERREGQAKLQTEVMKKDLGLTDAQYKKVYQINLEQAAKNEDAIKNKKTWTAQERKALADRHEVKLREILSADQYSHLTAKKAEMQKAGSMHGPVQTDKK